MGSTDPAGMTDAADQIAGQLRKERIEPFCSARSDRSARAPCARWHICWKNEGFDSGDASVRAQAEKTRPPRALWTTSQLGRPLGEPGDIAFQRRVLMAALALLERTDGPVILEDFTEDPPGWRDDRPGPSRRCPRSAATPKGPDAWETAFRAELTALLPLWRKAQARFGRTTVGLSFQAPAAWPGFATRFLAGELPTVPELDTPALALRMVADDIKALYGEAAQAEGPAPAAHQVDRGSGDGPSPASCSWRSVSRRWQAKTTR